MNKTLDYYNKNAKDFVSGTINADFLEVEDKFLGYLKPNSTILDFGCGSGRDTKYFLSKGYTVDATDGSEELCRIASSNTGIQVRHLLFEELNEKDKYDGIWACASILHCSHESLPKVFDLMHQALKEKGILYTSFKYGTYEGEKNGRFFIYLNEETIKPYITEYELVEQWISSDVRAGRAEEKWLNVILRKK